MKELVVLGSTGSIGKSTLDVVRTHSDKLRVVALSVSSNFAELCRQINEFAPHSVAIRDASVAEQVRQAWPQLRVFTGDLGATQLVECVEADMVVAAISGMAGLRPVISAVRKGMKIALANKEALVAAGEILLSEASRSGAQLLPVDSEHSAIWQALQGWAPSAVRRLILTASGGPFFGKNSFELSSVTCIEALNHPTWKMGGKISVDSATLMNKGLEVIEAHHLFGIDYQHIDVLVHPQSIVHSIVEFVDGCQLAQCSRPDMRMPIQLALSYPERWESHYVNNDYAKEQWSFYQPDCITFPSLSLAIEAGKRGGPTPAILNAANEVAVHAFLEGELDFLAIPQIVSDVLATVYLGSFATIEDVFEADSWARQQATGILRKRSV